MTKLIIALGAVVLLAILVSACTIPGVGDYQKRVNLGCTTDKNGLVCPDMKKTKEVRYVRQEP